MAYQPEVVSYDAGIYQIEITDPVDGGVGSITNSPLLSLANRTAYLKQHMDALEAGTTLIDAYATKASPALTGSPTTPNQAVGDDSTKIANTAFVQDAVNGSATVSIAGSTTTTLTQAQYGYPLIILSGAVTAAKSVVFPTQTGWWLVTNNSTGAYTVTLKTAAGTGVYIPIGYSGWIYCDGTNIVSGTTFASSMYVAGATALKGTLAVAGTSTLSGILSVNGATTLSSTLAVTGAATLASTLSVGDTATFKSGVTAAGSITAAGSLVSTATYAFRSVGGNYGTALYNDGASLYVMVTNSGDQYGGYNALRPFQVNFASGLVTVGNGLNVSGATAVSGALTVTGAAALQSTLTVTGTTTLTGAMTTPSQITLNNGTDDTPEIHWATTTRDLYCDIASDTWRLFTALKASGSATEFPLQINLTSKLTSLYGALGVTGATTIAGILQVQSDVAFSKTLNVTGNIASGGTIVTTGTIQSNSSLVASAGYASLVSNVLRLQTNDSTNASNEHVWFYNYDGTERALMYVDSAGTFYFRALGGSVNFTIQPGGNSYTRGAVYAGGGTGFLGADGDTYGSLWGGYLYNYLANYYVGISNAAGNIGQYAFARNLTSTTLTFGATIAGTSLSPADSSENHSGTLTGTWRCLGYCVGTNECLFLRIA